MTLDDKFAAVMQAARRGEEVAIAQLYRDVNPRLLAYLRARAPTVAEDLASEVWLAAARYLASFEGDERAWHGFLFTIARRQVAGHWRSAKRRRTDVVPPESLEQEADSSDVAESGIRSASTRESIDLIVRALSKEQADVILLRVISGLDLEEVARILDKKPATVRVIQHRALRRLAQRLGQTLVMR